MNLMAEASLSLPGPNTFVGPVQLFPVGAADWEEIPIDDFEVHQLVEPGREGRHVDLRSTVERLAAMARREPWGEQTAVTSEKEERT